MDDFKLFDERILIDELVSAYQKLQVTFDSLKSFNILGFTVEAQKIYTNSINQKIKVGRKDLRIAAISLSVNGIFVTRNDRDFSQVTNLVVENWTL